MRRGLFLLFLLCALVSLVSPFSAGAGLNTQESALLQEMNRVRVAHGVPALQNDTHLQRAATSHSREMLESNTFSHGAFGSRMLQFDVSFNTAGENLAWGTGSLGRAHAIVAAWLASPEHRANLLRPSFRRVGIGEVAGTFQGHGGAHVVTADFAG
jgi:uncharacterized protein YkwD